MHPILGDARRLSLYLLAWVPLGGFLHFFLSPLNLGWKTLVLFIGPLCVVYAFICLAAWYTCRGLPIREGNLIRLITTHALSSIIDGGIWTLLAWPLGSVLGIAHGTLARAVLPAIFGVGVLLYLLFVSIYYVLLAVEASQEARQRADEARIQAGRAELRALRAQINPHFLYNSLNSISALTTIDPSKAREMCIQLSEFMRNTLGMSEETSVPLRQEIELVQRYLAIEKVRFGQRLTLEQEIPSECEEDLVPALILQPLIENAIVHGIANVLEKGTIRISANHTGEQRLTLVIENTYEDEGHRMPKDGFGLTNIRRRLQTIYGQDGRVAVSNDGGLFRVQLALPRQR
jgi:two-component system, LytTR family, sensor histidine kinase AlgZ